MMQVAGRSASLLAMSTVVFAWPSIRLKVPKTMKEFEEEMTKMKAIIAGMQNAVGGNFQEEMAEMRAAVAGLQEGRHDSKQSNQMQAPEVAQARRQQVSWNDIHSPALTVGTDQHQASADTNDLTVDKWSFKQSCGMARLSPLTLGS